MSESTRNNIKCVESTGTSHPECFLRILTYSKGRVIAEAMGFSREPGGRVAHRIVTENTSSRRYGPEDSVLRLYAIIDQILTLTERGVENTAHRGELSPIVPGEPFARTEPQKTLAIHQDAVDVGAGKAL